MSEHMESRSLPVDVGDNTAFETILRSTQPELKILLQAWLHRHGYAPISRRGYLYAEGSVPVLLVAHLDTVHRELVRDICYNADQTVVMSPQGIGGDDRAGVWMTLYILQHVRCHVVFCEDEEIGCVGARKFSRRKQLPRVNYIVEMDRRGGNDAVFYRCDNPSFTEYICEFGFELAYGSCSDISYIAPCMDVAAVNISCGYYCEHQRHEYIRMDQMRKNAQRIAEMVATPSPRFEYREQRDDSIDFWRYSRWEQSVIPCQADVMPIPKGAKVMLHGQRLEEDQFCMDRQGTVYRFLPELQAILPIEQASAQDTGGCQLPFCAGAACIRQIISIEEAIERLRTTI